MIKISHLSYKYPQTQDLVLKDISLTIDPDSLTLVIGPSGSGKSTLLRCVNALVPHFSGGEISGTVDVFGSNPIKQGVKEMAKKVGMVFQQPESQFVYDIVEDEIAFGLENQGMERIEMHQRLEKVLEELDIKDLRHMKIRSLSGGEKQKVAIASVLAAKPKVLLLDEPTSQLDPRSADEVLQFITILKKRLRMTILISEHRLERLLPFTDNVIYIGDDHKAAFGSPQEIIPETDLAPPIVKIAKKFNIKPIPLVPADFPEVSLIGKIEVEKDTGIKGLENENVLLSVKNLSTMIKGKHILKNVSINLNINEIFTLIGKNGSGKTTLLRSILGLIPSNGEKYLKGKEISDLPAGELIQHFAYLPQNPNDLLFAESILEELQITLRNHNMEKEETQLNEFLQQFNLSEKSHRYPRDLSTGEIQRTALAAITVHDPKIILLDEPTRGLDYAAKENLVQILHQWRNMGRSILLITQDVEFAAHVTDRAGILEAGKIIFSGSPRMVFTQFPIFQTQTARIFPEKGWILPQDVVIDI